MTRRPSAEAVVSFVIVAASALAIFFALHPSKIFLNTTPAGGDMGAHVWAPQYLRDHLLPHGRISGWAPAWYDGFPALTFYFPLPYLVIALASYVLPYGVAFKLVSISGLVGLPVAAWAFGRLLRMRFPAPPLLALATVPYVFERYWTIYGGNIASTLAGEFSFSIALALALVFLGVFARSLETGRYRGIAAVLFAATMLCHILPTFFAIVGAVLLFVMRPNRQRLRVAAIVGVLGLAIAAVWLLPFAARLGYSNDMGWERTTEYLKNLFPWLQKKSVTPANYTHHLPIVVALAAAGAIGGMALRRRGTLLITGLGVASALAFRLMQQGTLWNARMLPFWFLSLYLAAAAGVAEAAYALGVLFGRRPRPEPEWEWVAGAPVLSRHAADELELVGAGGGPGGVGGSERWWARQVVAGGGAPLDFGVDNPSSANGGGGADGNGALHEAGGRRDHLDHPEDGDEEEALVPNRWPMLAAPLLGAVLLWLFVGGSAAIVPSWLSAVRLSPPGDRNFVLDWANWNYSGYERKSAYPEYRDVIQTMQQVGARDGCGRAMWEYQSEEDRFGTPMALMLLPKWTNGCIDSMEGLFFESSATVPYHFYDQGELSASPSDAMRDLPYRGLDVADGIAHLRLLGVRYYMAITPEAQNQARAVPGIHLVATTSPHQISYTVAGSTHNEQRAWQVYEIDNSPTDPTPVDLVAPLKDEPAVMTGVPTKGKGWQHVSLCSQKLGSSCLGWYQDAARWDVPLAASGPPDWPRVKGADANPPRIPVRAAVISNITTSDDRVRFDVDAPGTPVLVKVSYFPNWTVTGARGPWRVTPNLMVVIPTSTHVELHYGFTPVDDAGRILTIAGLIGAGVLTRNELSGRAPQDSGVPRAPFPEPVPPNDVDDVRDGSGERRRDDEAGVVVPGA